MLATLLDTCVLWPSFQRDFLLSLAIEGMYRPLWSSAILEELAECEAEKLQERGWTVPEAQRRSAHLIARMRSSFGDAEVSGWHDLEGSFGLPDPDDEHVLAAAVVGGAGVLVTWNLSDFPCEKVPPGLEVLTPVDFTFEIVALDPARALGAVNALVARSGRVGPKLTVDDVLDVLDRRYHLGGAVTLLDEARRDGA